MRSTLNPVRSSSTTSWPSMKPSSFKITAIAAFNLELGMATKVCPAMIPLRMRVSMSEIGSFTDIITPLRLPGGFHHAGDFAFQGILAETNAAQSEAAHIAARPTTDLAAIAHADGVFAPRFSRDD